MKHLLKIFFLLSSTTCLAQDPELGIFGGGSYYLGDLNPYGHFQQTQPAVGAIYRFNTSNDRIVWRINALYGEVMGDDALSNDQLRQDRNLSFNSKIVEIGPVIEINFFDYELGNTSRKEYVFATPYMFAGISIFKMNPTAEYDGELYELQSLSTEGQGTTLNPDQKQYRLTQISVPLGLGFKFNLSKRVAMSFEYGVRKTFTDYLDDVSGKYVDANLLEEEAGVLSSVLSNRSFDRSSNTFYSGYERGNSKNKDWYSFAGVILSFKLITNTQCKRNFRKK